MRHWIQKTTIVCILTTLNIAASANSLLAVKVNGVEITAQEVEDFNALVEEKQGFKITPAAAANELVKRELLAQEAMRQGKGKDKNVSKLDLARDIFQEYEINNAFGEPDVQRAYDKLQSDALREIELSIRVIVVKTKAEASIIIASLDSGKPFSFFLNKSIDNMSKKNEGLLGWLSPRDLEPAYKKAVSMLEPQSYSTTPVRSNAGFAVLKLEAIRHPQIPEYLDIRDKLIANIVNERQEKLMKPLFDNARIERFEGYRIK